MILIQNISYEYPNIFTRGIGLHALPLAAVLRVIDNKLLAPAF